MAYKWGVLTTYELGWCSSTHRFFGFLLQLLSYAWFFPARHADGRMVQETPYLLLLATFLLLFCRCIWRGSHIYIYVCNVYIANKIIVHVYVNIYIYTYTYIYTVYSILISLLGPYIHIPNYISILQTTTLFGYKNELLVRRDAKETNLPTAARKGQRTSSVGLGAQSAGKQTYGLMDLPPIPSSQKNSATILDSYIHHPWCHDPKTLWPGIQPANMEHQTPLRFNGDAPRNTKLRAQWLDPPAGKNQRLEVYLSLKKKIGR